MSGIFLRLSPHVTTLLYSPFASKNWPIHVTHVLSCYLTLLALSNGEHRKKIGRRKREVTVIVFLLSHCEAMLDVIVHTHHPFQVDLSTWLSFLVSLIVPPLYLVLIPCNSYNTNPEVLHTSQIFFFKNTFLSNPNLRVYLFLIENHQDERQVLEINGT